MKIQSYRDLVVWQRAMGFAELVYRLTRQFPKEEQYGLTLQVRRSAVSIPSNIAEGQGRRTARAFLSFLHIAGGSLKEVETQLLLAHRLAYLTDQDISEAMQCGAGVGRPLSGLIKSLKSGLKRKKDSD